MEFEELDSQRAIGRRDGARLRLQLPGRVKTLDGDQNCIVEDISQTGARIDLPEPHKISHAGILRCGDLDLFFDRVWTNSTRVGLMFEEIVSAEMLCELRRTHDNFDEIQRLTHRRTARDWVEGKIR